MGGSQSKTVVNSLSQNLNNVIVNTMQSCEVAADQTQSLNETNTGIWLFSSSKLTQQSDISAQCFSDSSKQTQLQNNIINTIAQSATTKGVALLDAFATPGSTAMSNLTNIVKNNVTMSNIQKNYTAIRQAQSASFSNSGVMIYRAQDLTQGSQLFAAATLQEMSTAGIFDTISNHLDQTASTTTENPLQFLTGLVGSITSGITSGITGTLLFFGFIIFLIIMMFRFIGGSDDESVPQSPPPPQEPSEMPENTTQEVMPTGIEPEPEPESNPV